MERSDVVRQLREYRVHLAAELRRTDQALRAFGIVEEVPGAPARPGPRPGTATNSPSRVATGQPGGTYDVLRQVLRERGQQPITIREATDALTAHGWQTDAENPGNAVATALTKLATRGELRRVGRGKYQLAIIPEHHDVETAASEGGTAPSDDESAAPIDDAAVPVSPLPRADNFALVR